MNISSFWLLVGNSYASLNRMALILTVVILGIGLYIVLVYKKKINTPSTFLSIAVWSVWTVILFLPAMHERYTYMLDILLVMICVLNWRYLPFAIGETILSLITYGYYLFGSGSINIVFAVVNVILWISFGLTLGKFEFIDKKDSSERTVKCPS